MNACVYCGETLCWCDADAERAAVIEAAYAWRASWPPAEVGLPEPWDTTSLALIDAVDAYAAGLERRGAGNRSATASPEPVAPSGPSRGTETPKPETGR